MTAEVTERPKAESESVVDRALLLEETFQEQRNRVEDDRKAS